MVRVRVRAFAQLGKALGHEFDLRVKSGSTVGDLLRILEDRIGRGSKLVSCDGTIPAGLSVLLNGLSVQLSGGSRTALSEGDVVSLLPASAGG